ncbi:O-antigen transporter [Fulvivirga imtechensis AK7]|uniref:O-antigen transporter n=1 Tax=Fulvivirga imtechensis AK7 TaxID=1237149 RepID=L8JUJ4_9BACT|nr:flippase [Fulvivirga imtechensis]ELR71224.1 O-antigen transporter [Fulvivirga imtechensis AK7]
MRQKRSLFKNFSWLATSQVANVVIPLVAYPYLLRTIDIEKFGLVVFAQAVVTYFVYVIDFGFSITAVREVSINRDNPEKLSAVFSNLYVTKLLLLLVCFGLLLLLIFSIPDWKGEKWLFISSFTIVAGQLLLPLWLFQGLEKMKGVAAMNFLSKIGFVLMVLLLVRENNDYKWVNLYLGSSQIVAGLGGIAYGMWKFSVRFSFPSFSDIRKQITHNQPLFVSVFAGFVANNSGLFILGLMADPVSIGYYGIVEKILLAIRAPAMLLYQSVFPRVCVLAEQSFEVLLSFLKKITRLIFIGFIPLGIGVFMLSEEIVWLFAGQQLETPATLLKIVSFAPLMAALNIPACHTMLAYNFKKGYAAITILGALFNISFNIIFISLFAAYGAASIALATEMLITMVLYLYLEIRHKNFSVVSVFKLE